MHEYDTRWRIFHLTVDGTPCVFYLGKTAFGREYLGEFTFRDWDGKVSLACKDITLDYLFTGRYLQSNFPKETS
jgi:hypothetical protein